MVLGIGNRDAAPAGALRGFSHLVTRGRFSGWHQKFHHWLQCEILTLTSKNQPRVTNVETTSLAQRRIVHKRDVSPAQPCTFTSRGTQCSSRSTWTHTCSSYSIDVSRDATRPASSACSGSHGRNSRRTRSFQHSVPVELPKDAAHDAPFGCNATHEVPNGYNATRKRVVQRCNA